MMTTKTISNHSDQMLSTPASTSVANQSASHGENAVDAWQQVHASIFVKKKLLDVGRRRPPVFSTNANGSMVNIRCGEHESLTTFQQPQTSTGSAAGLVGRMAAEDELAIHARVKGGRSSSKRYVDGARRPPEVWTTHTCYRPMLQMTNEAFASNFCPRDDRVSLLDQTPL